jgi:hypothetical protein
MKAARSLRGFEGLKTKKLIGDDFMRFATTNKK